VSTFLVRGAPERGRIRSAGTARILSKHLLSGTRNAGEPVAVLEHKMECVAAWTYIPEEGVIACRGCSQVYESTPERRFAADFEAVLTRHMRGMADEGLALISREARTRPRWAASD
jgi:hypothetical protein